MQVGASRQQAGVGLGFRVAVSQQRHVDDRRFPHLMRTERRVSFVSVLSQISTMISKHVGVVQRAYWCLNMVCAEQSTGLAGLRRISVALTALNSAVHASLKGLLPFDWLHHRSTCHERGNTMSAHRAGPGLASLLCAEVVQRLRLRGEDADQQMLRQVCPAAVGLRRGMDYFCRGVP